MNRQRIVLQSKREPDNRYRVSIWRDGEDDFYRILYRGTKDEAGAVFDAVEAAFDVAGLGLRSVLDGEDVRVARYGS